MALKAALRFLRVCYSCFFLLPVNECAFKSVVKIGSCTKNMSGFMSSELLHIDRCFRDRRVGSGLSLFWVCTLVDEMFLTKVIIGSVLIVLRSVHKVCATCAGNKNCHIFRYVLLSQCFFFNCLETTCSSAIAKMGFIVLVQLQHISMCITSY
uniref:Secreted protein n=1 Tax=Ixodes ricinus TaxID=34613 RepID=A0A6B0UVT1_IXORI